MIMKRVYLSISILIWILITAVASFAQDASATTDIQVEQAVLYGEANGEELLLDVYQPPTRDNPRPAVLVFHAGGGVIGSRDWMSGHATGLAQAGYVVFNIDHRLLGDDNRNPWPAQLEDAQQALRWVWTYAEDYNVDPDRVCALGHSFGGKLAALLGLEDVPDVDEAVAAPASRRVACVVTAAANLDPTQPLLEVEDRENTLRMMGGTLSEVPERYEDASPLAHVSSDAVPFLVFHGASDQLVTMAEARNFVDAMHNARVEVTYIEVPSADHFYWFDWESMRPETLAFLERHLHPEQ
jgi:acetyl esterase/lipase